MENSELVLAEENVATNVIQIAPQNVPVVPAEVKKDDPITNLLAEVGPNKDPDAFVKEDENKLIIEQEKKEESDKIFGPQRPEQIVDSIKKEQALALLDKAVKEEMFGKGNYYNNVISRRGQGNNFQIGIHKCGVCGSIGHSSLQHIHATKGRKKIKRFNPKMTIPTRTLRSFITKHNSKRIL